jgi:hypothetical protein
MSATLGYEDVLTDGGFGGMQGVDYAPLLEGKSTTAVPCQPFWWRYFRTLHLLNIRQHGECTDGWMGANISVGGPGDVNNIWMFQGGSIVFATQFLKTPETMHQGYQLYNNCWNDKPEVAAVRRYALKIYEKYPAPDWIELHNLRQGDPVDVTQTQGALPGIPMKASVDTPYKYTIRPWTWDDVIWHFKDGTQLVIPAYNKIDWSKE